MPADDIFYNFNMIKSITNLNILVVIFVRRRGEESHKVAGANGMIIALFRKNFLKIGDNRSI